MKSKDKFECVVLNQPVQQNFFPSIFADFFASTDLWIRNNPFVVSIFLAFFIFAVFVLSFFGSGLYA